MSAEKPWLLVRVDDPLMLQVSIYGESHLSDGWPADPAAFGAAIFSARQTRKWSMTTLAKRARVSEVTVRNTERGTTNASLQVRQLLIDALALPVNPRVKESTDDELNKTSHPEPASQAKAQPGENIGQTHPPTFKTPPGGGRGVR